MHALGGETILRSCNPRDDRFGASFKITARPQVPPARATGGHAVPDARLRRVQNELVAPAMMQADAEFGFITPVSQAKSPKRVKNLTPKRHVTAVHVADG